MPSVRYDFAPNNPSPSPTPDCMVASSLLQLLSPIRVLVHPFLAQLPKTECFSYFLRFLGSSLVHSEILQLPKVTTT